MNKLVFKPGAQGEGPELGGPAGQRRGEQRQQQRVVVRL
eukprot:CAMPEP_0194693328 /NCGR_PEP_ID=MMETSP0295-20121207/20461_1 /TAXON_ID=39354 /ORGANISM="Heterosigma akashiwo, Strain CCMP2393" /LENGTH=38 /DNA_ID= /DNA_START= /DNA_END= /DNA_ORIENTATION=